MSELNRRGFLVGLGAAIVALNAPAIAGATERTFTPFVVPSNDWAGFTAGYLAKTIAALGRQVEELGPLTSAERETVVGMIDRAIDEIRPIGILVRVSLPFDLMARSQFSIIEVSPGTVDIGPAIS